MVNVSLRMFSFFPTQIFIKRSMCKPIYIYSYVGIIQHSFEYSSLSLFTSLFFKVCSKHISFFFLRQIFIKCCMHKQMYNYFLLWNHSSFLFVLLAASFYSFFRAVLIHQQLLERKAVPYIHGFFTRLTVVFFVCLV